MKKYLLLLLLIFVFSCKIKPSDNDIKNAAKEMFKKQLLTPATAKFPPNNEIQLIRDKGDSTFYVSSYIDAQNGFGALIRQDWKIHIWYLGGEYSDPESWKLLYE